MVSNRMKKIKSGVFIDYSNIFWAENSYYDWTIDYYKLKNYLKKHYSPLFYNLYCAKDLAPSTTEFERKAKGAERFFNRLSGFGYNIIEEPLKYIIGKDRILTKGDRDSAIITDIQGYLKDIDGIILFSGDDDFLKIIEYCYNCGKHIRIYSYDKTLSYKVRLFAFSQPRCNFTLIDELKPKIQFLRKTSKFSTKRA